MKWAATSVRQQQFDVTNMAKQGNVNDQIAAAAFGAATHFPPTAFEELAEHDGVFVTMWKIHERSFEPRWMEVVHRLCDAGRRVVLFQEAEIDWALNRSWDEQKSFFELLGKVDAFLTHNERDIALWGAFRHGKVTQRWRTCLNLSVIESRRIHPGLKMTKPILFGSSFDGRANGLTGLVACKELGYPLIHQNRSVGYEHRNFDIQHALGLRFTDIPVGGWVQWLEAISPAFIAVHPMPAAAAGRDQIAFACLGIPCVGNPELDAQRDLFPDLCVDPFDVMGIRKRVTTLLSDDAFYGDVRRNAMDQVTRFGLKAAGEQAARIKERMEWQ